MEQKFPGRNFQKFAYNPRGLSSFPKIVKNAVIFYSPLKISGNKNRNFWSNEKRL